MTWLCVWELMLPARRTHPNSVSNADGEPEGPIRRPWPNTSMKISTPKRSTLPGHPRSGSARGISTTCFHSRLNGTECRGRSQVMWGTTITVISYFFEGLRVADTLKLAIICKGELWVRPATPDILVFWCERGRHSVWDKRLDTNEADDAKSRIALASIKEPSEASTKIQQVMNRDLDNPATALDLIGLVVVSEEGLVVEGMHTADAYLFCKEHNRVCSAGGKGCNGFTSSVMLLCWSLWQTTCLWSETRASEAWAWRLMNSRSFW